MSSKMCWKEKNSELLILASNFFNEMRRQIITDFSTWSGLHFNIFPKECTHGNDYTRTYKGFTRE